MKRKMLPLFAPTLLLLAAMLAGCNKDEDRPANQLPDGKHPLTLTATVEESTATRATPDGTWNGGEEVAIEIGGVAKKYIADSDGNLTVAPLGTPWYWKSTTETKTVLAWISYSATEPTEPTEPGVPTVPIKPTTFTVKEGQRGDGYGKSDMLWSSGTISYESSKLEFKHLPAKVVVNLTYSEANIPEVDRQNTIVTLVNQNLTSGAITINNNVWSVAKQTASGNDEINTNALPTANNGYHKTVQALVVPQQVQQNKAFIKVAIGTGAAARNYYYTPTTSVDLESGKQHTYNINVSMKNGITVTTSEVTAWNEGSTTNVTSTGVALPDFGPLDLKMGDFYYSDGTTGDGGYRKYTGSVVKHLPIKPVLTDANGKSRTVLGIVLKVGKDGNDNCGYKSKGNNNSMGVRGYVLALNDANSGNACWWTSWDFCHHNGTQLDDSGNRFDSGYTNTNIIKAYTANNNKSLKGDVSATYHTSVGYEALYPAPDNSSGWFFPSVGQVKYWYNNKGVILESVKSATDNSSYNWKEHYWSSSEGNELQTKLVTFANGNVSLIYKYNTGYVRSFLAF